MLITWIYLLSENSLSCSCILYSNGGGGGGGREIKREREGRGKEERREGKERKEKRKGKKEKGKGGRKTEKKQTDTDHLKGTALWLLKRIITFRNSCTIRFTGRKKLRYNKKKLADYFPKGNGNYSLKSIFNFL